jgi:Flp pilus assembly pilin Flp
LPCFERVRAQVCGEGARFGYGVSATHNIGFESERNETVMNKLSALLIKLREDERGLSTVEYVVLLVLIVAMAVAAWNSFGSRVQGKLTQASDSFDTTVQTNGVGAGGDNNGGAGGAGGGGGGTDSP